jgi:hypothetical protein
LPGNRSIQFLNILHDLAHTLGPRRESRAL